MSPVRDEDALDLPPLDGEETDPTKGDDFEDPLASLEDDGADPFDDATAEDEPVDEPIDALEDDASSALDDTPADVEIEAPALVERLAAIAGADDEPAELDDGGVTFEDDEVTLGGDRGEEGFAEGEEALDESALPALDADEEGEADEGLFFDDERTAAGDDLVFSERGWPVKAKVPLGDVVHVAVAGLRVDARLATGAAVRSVDGGKTFAASDLPPTSVPPPRGTTLRLPGERVVSIRSGFDRCLVLCGGNATTPRPIRIVCDLSMELDADAGDVAVRALAYDVGTTTLWIACKWGIVGLDVPRDDVTDGAKVSVS
jgi:hypothetical protein